MEPQIFSFTRNQKIVFILLMLIGVVAAVYGLVILPHERFWANLLLNTFYFLAIALAGTFFVSVHIVGQSGWQSSIERIPLAMGTFVPVTAIFMLVILIFGMHDIYHWTHDHLDEVLQGKTPYLNTGFFVARMVVYFGGWIFLAYKLRQVMLQGDHSPELSSFRKSHVWAILFIVFFAITNSTSSWDLLMSIDPHWYSTLYAWYIFSSLFVSGVAVIILILIYLRSKGYMAHTNNEHLHDLGKYLFGISILWMYLWFSQFMLIWYGNIPEETTYFIQRVDDFNTLFYLNIGINFFIPFLVLLPRRSPRKAIIMVIASVIVIIGHWIDFYLVVMPGSIGDKSGIGFLEVGLTLGFTGMFLYVVFRSLSKASLVPSNHPYFKESLEYENL
jgi:hypothetical protein